MSSTVFGPDVEQTLKDRLLHSLGERFAEQLLIVTTGDAMGDQIHQMGITLTAPGMSPDDLESINALLVMRLRGALNPLQNDRNYTDAQTPEVAYDERDQMVYSIWFGKELEFGPTQIMVEFTDSSFLGFAAHDAVLDTVRGILAPVAKQHWRKLVILKGGECYVPLQFDMNDISRGSMSVRLPAGLEIIDARRFGDDYHEDPVRRACKSLNRTLEVMMPLATARAASIQAHLERDGTVRIVVVFKRDGRMPTASDLNAVQEFILDVLRLHVRKVGGFFTALVFASVNPAVDEADS